MKKSYLKPEQRVVKIQQHSIICSSPLTSISNNAELNYGGGSSTQSARVKSNTVDWDDWE